MKALELLTNTEKARLLHNLFPAEIPIFLAHLNEVCIAFQEHKEEYSKLWDNGFIPFGYWLSLSEETAELLKRLQFSMTKNSKVFSDQLFYTYTSILVNDRIIKYADRISKNEKFKTAVDLLYRV
ncbi:hypothetical protein [Pedobacter panaciterrae]